MKTQSKILITAIACIGIASAALAHNHGHDGGKGPRAERVFQQMDTDGDGRVSREDARSFAIARFARVDADGDGQITKDERRAARKARRGERMARLDTDGDGMISKVEMSAMAAERAERRFARMDADGDGFVSIAEAMAARGKRGEHGSARAGGGKHGPATRAMMEERVLNRFDRMDQDRDGIITIEDVR